MPYFANVENIHRPWNKGKLLGQKPQNRENNCKPGEPYWKMPSFAKSQHLTGCIVLRTGANTPEGNYQVLIFLYNRTRYFELISRLWGLYISRS